MNVNKFRAVFANRNALIDVLAIFFGIGSWIGINSLFIQLPLLVNVLPESWNLASYMVIIIQLANVGPIFYTLIQKTCPIPDNIIIYLLLIIGIIMGVLMTFNYGITSTLLGQERSIVFFSIVLGFALVGCTSSVLFMPYFGRFRDIYLVTYLIGEGLSGLLPGVLGLIQGVGGNAQCIKNENKTKPEDSDLIEYYPPPRFSTETFFIIISSLFIAALIAFILLDQLKSVRKEYAKVTIGHGNKFKYHDHHDDSMTNSDEKKETETEHTEIVKKVKKLSTMNYRGLLVLLGVVCMFVNAIFPSVMPFGTLPYGNVTYHLSVTLSSIANPLACFIAVFITGTSIRNIITLSIISIPFVVYSLVIALLSPTPPLVGTSLGEALIIVSWTLVVGFASYIRLKITTIFRSQGGKSLVWVGAWTQIGSCVGSILSFIAVNYTSAFQSFSPCKK